MELDKWLIEQKELKTKLIYDDTFNKESIMLGELILVLLKEIQLMLVLPML